MGAVAGTPEGSQYLFSLLWTKTTTNNNRINTRLQRERAPDLMGWTGGTQHASEATNTKNKSGPYGMVNISADICVCAGRRPQNRMD